MIPSEVTKIDFLSTQLQNLIYQSKGEVYAEDSYVYAKGCPLLSVLHFLILPLRIKITPKCDLNMFLYWHAERGV